MASKLGPKCFEAFKKRTLADQRITGQGLHVCKGPNLQETN